MHDNILLFKRLQQILNKDELQMHAKKEVERMLYEIKTTIYSFNHLNDIHSNSLLMTEFKQMYKEGDGLTLVSTEHDNHRFHIRLIDIWNRNVILYAQVPNDFERPDYFNVAGHTRDPRAYGPIYKCYLGLVHGDVEKILRIITAYYQQWNEYKCHVIKELKSKV